jgi:hypothetical protein
MNETKFPTEIVELPSQGLIYPIDHPLHSGKIEMKYMTAKEEDILTNQNYIQKGIVLDKLLEALIMNKFSLKDMITGDKNSLIVASRILGYGKDYTFTYGGKEYTVDLTTLDNKLFDTSLITSRGTFKFTLPVSKTEVEFKLLTAKDEELIDQEIQGLKKLNKELSSEITTRLKYQLTTVDGSQDKNVIKEFVEFNLLAADSRALRLYIKEVAPDVNLSFTTESGEEVAIPINLTFFWPDI